MPQGRGNSTPYAINTEMGNPRVESLNRDENRGKGSYGRGRGRVNQNEGSMKKPYEDLLLCKSTKKI